MPEQLLGRADLHQHPLAHHRDAVGEPHRLLGVVGDEQAGRPRLAQQRERLVLDLLAQLDVEPGERLVHQHHRRPRRDRAGQRHALLLAARQNVRVVVGVAFQADAGEHGERLAPRLLGRQRVEAEGHVVEDGQVRKQREVLEHQADIALLGRHEPVRARRPPGR